LPESVISTATVMRILVWENTVTGQRTIWFLKNGVLSGTTYLPTLPVRWHIGNH